MACYADTAYLAAGPTIATPYRRQPGRELSDGQKDVNTAHARNTAPGERGVATLKTWKSADPAAVLRGPGPPPSPKQSWSYKPSTTRHKRS